MKWPPAIRLSILLAMTTAACGLVGRSPESRHGEAISQSAEAPAVLASLAADPVGSTVVVARLGMRTVAVAADTDESSLVVADIDSHQVLGRTPLDGTPAQILASREGWLFVALRDRARVAVFEPADWEGRLRERASVATDDEPFGLAETRDGTLLVVCALAHALDAFDARDLSKRFTVELPREPRAVLASPSEGRAYVAHLASGRVRAPHVSRAHGAPAASALAPLVSVVDWSGPNPQVALLSDRLADLPSTNDRVAPAAVQGYALAASPDGDLVVAPFVSALTGRVEVRTHTSYGDDKAARAAEVGMTAVLRDAEAGSGVSFGGSPSCLLPRAAVFPAASVYLVACADRDVVEEVPVDEPPRSPRVVRDWTKKWRRDDQAPRERKRRAWRVGEGITGLAFEPDGRRVVAWSQDARRLGVVALDAPDDLVPVVIAVPALRSGSGDDERVLRGRRIFHRSGDMRVALDGRACASCHPDGLDDGLTWATPDGPRQTPALRGRVVDTAPYGWLGKNQGLRDHLRQTVARLGGTGLDEPDASALVAYIVSMRAPKREAAANERGRGVFEERCASCHAPWAGLADGERHDVGSRAEGDLERVFDTPSLLRVGATAPYFHDGRYADLATLVDRSRGTMWRSPRGGLPPGDRDALLAFLQTL
jgi:mono/diheme cytochrome c family protein